MGIAEFNWLTEVTDHGVDVVALCTLPVVEDTFAVVVAAVVSKPLRWRPS